MSSRIKNLIKEFGVAQGVSFYGRLKIKNLGWFNSSKKKMRFYLRNNYTDAGIFRQVFIEKQYETPISFEPTTILDLGANTGLSALYFADRFPKAQIVALEPDAENYKIALGNTEQYSSIKVLQKGIWDKNTFLQIIDAGVSNDAFMVKETTDYSSQHIEATTIDTIMKQEGWDCIHILKIDIEGSEKEVFEGNFESWLPKTKLLFVEVHDQMKKGCSKAVFNAISKYNFSFTMKHENLIFINEDL